MLNYTVNLYNDKCINVHITHTSFYTAHPTDNHVGHTSARIPRMPRSFYRYAVCKVVTVVAAVARASARCCQMQGLYSNGDQRTNMEYCWNNTGIGDQRTNMEYCWNNTDRGKKKDVVGEKSVPVPLCPSQVPRRLPWD